MVGEGQLVQICSDFILTPSSPASYLLFFLSTFQVLEETFLQLTISEEEIWLQLRQLRWLADEKYLFQNLAKVNALEKKNSLI